MTKTIYKKGNPPLQVILCFRIYFDLISFSLRKLSKIFFVCGILIFTHSSSFANDHHCATCVGNNNCYACKTCNYCNYCNSGGRCGVCSSGTSLKNNSIEKSNVRSGYSSSQCKGITKKGSRCKRMVRGGGYCWQHKGI